MPIQTVYQIDDKWDVYREAQQALMSIPGYADYYADRLRAARDRVEAETDPNMKHSLIYRELKPAGGDLTILGSLPSPDSVRVLGEFLNDERGRFIQDPAHPVSGEKLWGMLETRTANCEYALGALASLPIVGKPKPSPKPNTGGRDPVDFTDIPAWREWYGRIKSGRATFRFEGDPVEYDLNGPAREARPPRRGPRARRGPSQPPLRFHRQRRNALHGRGKFRGGRIRHRSPPAPAAGRRPRGRRRRMVPHPGNETPRSMSAAAHEIGHVLPGTNHSKRLMTTGLFHLRGRLLVKAEWDKEARITSMAAV